MGLKRALKYLNYQLTASTDHDVHSPFVFSFYQNLITKPQASKDFASLDALRAQLLEDKTRIHFTDLGAGSKSLGDRERIVKDIARHGIAQKKQAEFLYRLVQYFSPSTVVELGTSLGLSSLYLAKANAHTQVYTIEGCPELATFAQKQFEAQQADNITLISGNFDDVLPQLLTTLPKVDLAYIDGNHAYEPTLRYFHLLLQKKHRDTILVFDDLYWSKDMERAWEAIYTQPEVTLSMDFFQFGIVFFRTEQKNKEHFVLKL